MICITRQSLVTSKTALNLLPGSYTQLLKQHTRQIGRTAYPFGFAAQICQIFKGFKNAACHHCILDAADNFAFFYFIA